MKILKLINLILSVILLIVLIFYHLYQTPLIVLVILIIILNIMLLLLREKKYLKSAAKHILWNDYIENFEKYASQGNSFILIKILNYQDYIKEYGDASYKNYYEYLINFLSNVLRDNDIIISKDTMDLIIIAIKDIPQAVFPERAQHLLHKLESKTVFKYKFFLKTFNNPEKKDILLLLKEIEDIMAIENNSNLIIL